jgi:hypothetical protein
VTVTIAGHKLKADPAALLAEYDAREPMQKPQFMLWCVKCKALCTVHNPCSSCKEYGRSFGGPKVRSITPHERLPIDDVLAVLRQAVAA